MVRSNQGSKDLLDTVVPVLMAGGNGSRLWPLSRSSHPKQFLALQGALSLLQNTALRARLIPGATDPVVIGAEAHRFLIAEQLRDAGVKDASIILEPEARDTAPAAAVAAHQALKEHGPDAIVFLMAADHAITDLDAFVEASESAIALAREGRIVTFGICPSGPETGFGYLRTGKAIDGSGGYEVEAFVEKPDEATAIEFLRKGNHYWNGGMFLFRADVFLAELEKLEPTLNQCAYAAVNMGKQSEQWLTLNAEAFASCRKVSVDYAVMERISGLALVPLEAGWDDVGSWNYLSNLEATDEHGNVSRGYVVLEQSSGNLVSAQKRLVTMIGMQDHVVVETGDAILIAPRNRVQDVKKVVDRLQRAGRSEVANHHRVARPWGAYESIADGDRFQVKRITVKPGEKLSLQMHHHRAEHWIVVRGTALVTCEDKEFLLCEDQSTYIPLGHKHRLENPGLVPLELIEVQSGAYLGEDDIVRFEDVYGRTAPLQAEAADVEVPENMAGC